jgi:hypothetical protein
MMKAVQTIIATTILSLGIAAAGFFVGQTLYNAQVSVNTAEVRGLAERRVTADKAYWRIGFNVAGAEGDEVASLYERSKADEKKIVALLTANGFSEEEIKVGVTDYSVYEYRDSNQRLIEKTIQLRGSIEIETDKVHLTSEMRSKLNELIAQGVDLQNHQPSYLYTQLNDIKPEMVREATKNARIAANEFAVNAGVKVGSIRSASQGGFTITDAGESYGDSRKLEKDVRVVTSVSFYLTR